MAFTGLHGPIGLDRPAWPDGLHGLSYSICSLVTRYDSLVTRAGMTACSCGSRPKYLPLSTYFIACRQIGLHGLMACMARLVWTNLHGPIGLDRLIGLDWHE